MKYSVSSPPHIPPYVWSHRERKRKLQNCPQLLFPVPLPSTMGIPGLENQDTTPSHSVSNCSHRSSPSFPSKNNNNNKLGFLHEFKFRILSPAAFFPPIRVGNNSLGAKRMEMLNLKKTEQLKLCVPET